MVPKLPRRPIDITEEQPFANGAEDTLRGVLNGSARMLPHYLSQRRRLVAWKAAPKIGNLTFVPCKREDDALDSTT